jgi:glycosyltransferase involved in cell wall biosynthesis
MMKVLVLSDTFPPHNKGGAGIITYRLARQLHQEGCQVSVIATRPEPGPVEIATREGLRVHTLPSQYPERFMAYLGLYNPLVLPSVRRIMEEVDPDVVHAHNVHLHLSFHSLKLAHDLGKPAFYTPRDVMTFAYGKFFQFIDFNDTSLPGQFDYRLSPWDSLRRYRFRYFPLRNLLIRRYIGKNVCRLITPSKALKEALAANKVGEALVIYDGIDVEEFQEPDESRLSAFKDRHGLRNRQVVLFGGRISYFKGGEQIVRAMAQIKRQSPEAILLVVGGIDGYSLTMKELAQNLGVSDGLAFTDWLTAEEMKLAYAASDVAVTPSIYLDCFPLINLEAMAAKKPIVGTCFGGTPEAVIDGETGYIVNPLNIEALADRITSLLLDPGKARQMGMAGSQRVRGEFSLEKQAARTIALYEEALRG